MVEGGKEVNQFCDSEMYYNYGHGGKGSMPDYDWKLYVK